jgi:hypothetical protein
LIWQTKCENNQQNRDEIESAIMIGWHKND